MALQFGSDDEKAFHRARDGLVAGFEATAAGRGHGWIAEQLLDFKWGYLGGDLARWAPAEISEILLGLYPAKVMLDEEDLDLIPPVVAAFLRHLGDEGVVAEAEAGARRADEVAAEFRTRALDPDNWSFGKRLWGDAAASGVDLTDPDSLQGFMAEFNERPRSERDAILGPPSTPGWHGPAAMAPGMAPPSAMSLPPVVLAPVEELTAIAAANRWVGRMSALVDFVGDGRPLTDRGNLKLADGKVLVKLLDTGDRFDEKINDRVFKTRSVDDLHGVTLAFRLAVESGLLAVEGRRVIPGPSLDLLEDRLALLGVLVGTLGDIGACQFWHRHDHYGFGWYAEDLDAEMWPMLLDLYVEGPMPLPDLQEEFWALLMEEYEFPTADARKLDLHQEFAASSVRRMFGLLEELAVVTVTGAVEAPGRFGMTEVTGGEVALAPVGTWVVNRMASAAVAAPVVGGLRDASAADLLAAASDRPAAEATAEIEAWVAHHGEHAAAELVAALGGVDETARGLGFRALLGIGPSAADAVATLADDAELAPYVTVWRVDTLVADEAEIDCTGDPERFIRLLAVVVELWGPTAAVAGWAGNAAGPAGLPAMLDATWKVGRPETEVVLAAIGSEHPDKVVAKAARKALFKYRSAR